MENRTKVVSASIYVLKNDSRGRYQKILSGIDINLSFGFLSTYSLATAESTYTRIKILRFGA